MTAEDPAVFEMKLGLGFSTLMSHRCTMSHSPVMLLDRKYCNMLLISSRIYGFVYVYMQVLYAYMPFLAQLVKNAKACRIYMYGNTRTYGRMYAILGRQVTYFPALNAKAFAGER